MKQEEFEKLMERRKEIKKKIKKYGKKVLTLRSQRNIIKTS